MHNAEAFLTHTSGPFGTVRACLLCGEFDRIPKGRGRGYGMREGNKSRGRMIQHVKENHPDELGRVPADWFHSDSAWNWRSARG